MVLLNTLGFVQRSFGYNFSKELVMYILYILVINIMTCICIIYIVTAVQNLDRMQLQKANEMETQVRVVKGVQQEYM